MDSGSLIATVLIPAAGRGTRMGGKRKQFRELGGAPLLVHTLRLFQASKSVEFAVVAAPMGETVDVESMLKRHGIDQGISVVAGGDSRQQSVAAALAAVPQESDLVLVHDAVRPFVPVDCIEAVVRAARRHGAASLAVPATDTLRRGAEDRFGETVDREGLFRMQTPQAFGRVLFEDAHRAAREGGYEETDDVALVQRLGRAVSIVEGSAMNFKVTTPDDWTLAEALWAHGRGEEVSRR